MLVAVDASALQDKPPTQFAISALMALPPLPGMVLARVPFEDEICMQKPMGELARQVPISGEIRPRDAKGRGQMAEFLLPCDRPLDRAAALAKRRRDGRRSTCAPVELIRRFWDPGAPGRPGAAAPNQA
jgi:hypothetical protein